MEIKFRIREVHDREYDIESIHIAYAYCKGCYYYGLTSEELPMAMKDITNFLMKKFHERAVFYFD